MLMFEPTKAFSNVANVGNRSGNVVPPAWLLRNARRFVAMLIEKGAKPGNLGRGPEIPYHRQMGGVDEASCETQENYSKAVNVVAIH